MQLMHVYVQKSTSTTRPRSDGSVSGRSPGVLNQSSVSVNSGAENWSGRDRASASRVAWLASRAAGWTAVLEPPHVDDPFAATIFVLWPVISSRRPVTVFEHSSDAVRLTSGIFSATSWSKLTSRLV